MKEPGARPGFCTAKELLLLFHHLAVFGPGGLMIFSLLPRNIHDVDAGAICALC
jgi:hypothetical protein